MNWYSSCTSTNCTAPPRSLSESRTEIDGTAPHATPQAIKNEHNNGTRYLVFIVILTRSSLCLCALSATDPKGQNIAQKTGKQVFLQGIKASAPEKYGVFPAEPFDKAEFRPEASPVIRESEGNRRHHGEIDEGRRDGT